MKQISIKKITAELDSFGATESYKEVVVNNALHYNDLVTEYEKGTLGRREYLLYQLSVQICKLILDQKKAFEKVNPKPEEEDDFMKMIKNLKPNRDRADSKNTGA